MLVGKHAIEFASTSSSNLCFGYSIYNMIPKITKVKYFRSSAREEDSVRDIQQCSAACHLVIIIILNTNTNIDTNITIIINNMVMFSNTLQPASW